MTRSLRGAPVAVFDTETTGVGPDARIVQIAIVRVDALGESDPVVVLSEIVDPGVPIPTEASDIHGITDAHVAGRPVFSELVDRIAGAFDGAIPCAYNFPFDSRLYAYENHRAMRRAPDLAPVGLDPLVWVKLTDRYEKSKRLVDVAARRGMTFDAHDAAADALVTARLLPVLLGEMGRGRRGQRGWVGPWATKLDLGDIDAFLAWQRVNALRQEVDFAAYRASKGQDAPSMEWHKLYGVKP